MQRIVNELLPKKVRPTHFLDHCRDELEAAFSAFQNLKSGDLVDSRNQRTMKDLHRILGFASQ